MKIKNKIKNGFLIFLTSVLKTKKKLFNPKRPRILIVSTTALGDTLFATPSIKALRKKYKNAYIGALVSKTAYSVLEKNPHIDKFFILKKNIFSLFSLFFKLKKENFQAICHFHSSQRMILPLCAILNPEFLIGTTGINKGLDCLIKNPLQHLKNHEIERRLSIVKELKADKCAQMEFFFKKSKKFKLSKRTIVIHPGASDNFRSYPKDSFVALAKTLKDELNAHVVITGSKAEKNLVDYIAEKSNSPSFTNLTLSALASLLQKADIVIVGDTGPLHLSLALKTKVIALFVPSDPKRFGPYKAKNCIVIKKEPTCFPCLKKECKDPVCFLQIEPKEILEECKKILK